MRSPAALAIALAVATLAAPSAARASGGWTWPVRGHVLTEFRNGGDPYAAGQHRGIDIAAPAGSPVVAATGGTVTFAGVAGSSGLTLSQRTADGRHAISYLHLSSVAVRRGERVAAGQPIAASGTSGARSTSAPHLHLGVRAADDRHGYVDPLRFLAPPAAPSPQPRPLPAPLPHGEPVRPDPAPVPAPAAQPGPVPVAAPADVPSPSAAPAPLPAAPGVRSSTRVPTAAAVGGAVATGVPSPPRPHPGASPGHTRRPDPSAPATAPAAVPGPGPLAAARAPSPDPRPAADRRPARVAVGWLAACAGLVCASVLLAGPAGPRARRRHVRTAFGLLLRAGSRG